MPKPEDGSRVFEPPAGRSTGNELARCLRCDAEATPSRSSIESQSRGRSSSGFISSLGCIRSGCAGVSNRERATGLAGSFDWQPMEREAAMSRSTDVKCLGTKLVSPREGIVSFLWMMGTWCRGQRVAKYLLSGKKQGFLESASCTFKPMDAVGRCRPWRRAFPGAPPPFGFREESANQ